MASFSPQPNATVPLSVTQTSANVALPAGLGPFSQLELNNKGSNWCYVQWGTGSQTATVPTTSGNSYPVGPGQCKLVSVSGSVANVAAICDTGLTTTLLITPGYGDS